MERVVQGLLFIILSWHLRLERGKVQQVLLNLPRAVTTYERFAI